MLSVRHKELEVRLDALKDSSLNELRSMQRAAQRAAEKPAADDAAPLSGADYLRRKKQASEARRSGDEAAGRLVESLYESLASRTVASRRLAPQDPRLTGHEGTMLLNAAYLVEASEEDHGREYLSLDISAAVVADLDAAVRHIRRYSTQHSEAIVTEDLSAARRFVAAVDSAAVLVNASTRFTDGGELGFGAEIGISTQKLHARGPMGLPEMTSTKYVVVGDGHVR